MDLLSYLGQMELLVVLIIVIIVTLTVQIWLSFVTPPQSSRRKLMISSWSPPSEGSIHGVLEIDATKALEYIKEIREKTGKHVTITHVAMKAIALGIKQAPSLNGRLIWGRFAPFETVDLGCLVNIEGGKDLANAKITNADKRSIADIAAVLQEKADRLRKGGDPDFKKINDTLKRLPVFIIRPLVYFTGFLASALGLNLPFMGVRPFPFGSCLVTSIGMMGLDIAFVPFTPFTRVPLLVMIGSIKNKPVVIEDQIVVRPILTITATLDHRFVDGAQCALLGKKAKEVLEDPKAFDTDEMQKSS
jgi:pyruvate dehydrogenase E2 component (dihydrolipoamide acetyltransferase)